MTDQQELFKAIPSVNEVMSDSRIQELEKRYSKAEVKKEIRRSFDLIRKEILDGKIDELNLSTVVQLVEKEVKQDMQPSLRPVINGTGVILHTNLGRSLLSPAIKDYVNQIMFSYSNLEYDLEKKQRGLRYHHVEKLIRELTGAEDALVVNNNAAAVMLVLDTLVQGQEVIVSRGELVEIGGSFRIPEIITKGGGTLHEVGTTNKTHLRDYQAALNDQTGAVLKVHTSNYRIIGFTERPDEAELYHFAQSAGIPLINDLGSGLLIDLSRFGLPKEPLIQEAVATSDIVTFSGDKLLGGPQAGIIAGKRSLVEKIKHNQMLRALRVDKMTLSSLAATLELYHNPQKAIQQIPTLQMITVKPAELKERAENLAAQINENVDHVKVEVKAGTSQVGGGSYPGYLLKTYLVCLAPTSGTSATDLEDNLRHGDQPIVARIEHDQIIFDVRTLQQGDGQVIIQRLTDLMD